MIDRAATHALPPMQVRIARQTERLDEVVAFYRDGLGLPELTRFVDHDGYSGVMLDLPGTGAHLEFTWTDHVVPPTPHVEDLLVLYLGRQEEVDKVMARSGAPTVPSANPYWDRVGLTTVDPDGFRVVLVARSWSKSLSSQSPAQRWSGGLEIEEYIGPRDALYDLFALAEDSTAQLDSYLHDGQLLVARRDDAIIGHLQLVNAAAQHAVEIKNMAVREAEQRRGVGARLVRAALHLAATGGHTEVVVATATADVGNLRFYQRQGFRFRSIERDAFNPAAGYPAGSSIDGIPLRDRIWLDRPIEPTAALPAQ